MGQFGVELVESAFRGELGLGFDAVVLLNSCTFCMYSFYYFFGLNTADVAFQGATQDLLGS